MGGEKRPFEIHKSFEFESLSTRVWKYNGKGKDEAASFGEYLPALLLKSDAEAGVSSKQAVKQASVNQLHKEKRILDRASCKGCL